MVFLIENSELLEGAEFLGGLVSSLSEAAEKSNLQLDSDGEPTGFTPVAQNFISLVKESGLGGFVRKVNHRNISVDVFEDFAFAYQCDGPAGVRAECHRFAPGAEYQVPAGSDEGGTTFDRDGLRKATRRLVRVRGSGPPDERSKALAAWYEDMADAMDGLSRAVYFDSDKARTRELAEDYRRKAAALGMDNTSGPESPR
ncbi:hypothetical protein A6A08_09070 [Nocardiopsis sp. TSRI0078]|uniref:hypothetical protein n=1 Tax=unclassified Nocardiopsis TaxID=2649073 RepID=UPI0009389653|nr:hypothetical protein [Nocardiopsis sp. TSRI0078]OKI15710.1 hypothetical protein A6A08_09070 [Nocardiopsis sp. TSRI0078]